MTNHTFRNKIEKPTLDELIKMNPNRVIRIVDGEIWIYRINDESFRTRTSSKEDSIKIMSTKRCKNLRSLVRVVRSIQSKHDWSEI